MEAAAKIAVPIITVILLFAVGLDLAPRDFAGVRPRAIVAGLLAPVFLLPALALALVAAFAPGPDVAAGLLLVAACPIGGISNVYSCRSVGPSRVVHDRFDYADAPMLVDVSSVIASTRSKGSSRPPGTSRTGLRLHLRWRVQHLRPHPGTGRCAAFASTPMRSTPIRLN